MAYQRWAIDATRQMMRGHQGIDWDIHAGLYENPPDSADYACNYVESQFPIPISRTVIRKRKSRSGMLGTSTIPYVGTARIGIDYLHMEREVKRIPKLEKEVADLRRRLGTQGRLTDIPVKPTLKANKPESKSENKLGTSVRDAFKNHDWA